MVFCFTCITFSSKVSLDSVTIITFVQSTQIARRFPDSRKYIVQVPWVKNVRESFVDGG